MKYPAFLLATHFVHTTECQEGDNCVAPKSASEYRGVRFPEFLPISIYVSQEEICDRKRLSLIQEKTLTKGLHFPGNQLADRAFQYNYVSNTLWLPSPGGLLPLTA